jgi:hypothetical protein
MQNKQVKQHKEVKINEDNKREVFSQSDFLLHENAKSGHSKLTG